MKVTMPEALTYTVLGVAVVFLVLVFLMCITYILAAIFKSRKAKIEAPASASAQSAPPAEVAVRAAQPAVPQTTASSAPAQPAPAAPAVPAAPAAPARAASVSASAPPVIRTAGPRRYKVVVDGVDYDVGAEVENEGAAAYYTAPMGSARGQAAGGSAGSGKFKVVIDGVDYEVDAEVKNTGEGR